MKNIKQLCSTFVLLVTIAPAALAAFTGGGSGSTDDPYRITTSAELAEVKDNLAAHFILMNDIDLSGESNWAANTIGSSAFSGFSGTFNGNGHTIENVTISDPGVDNVGFFKNIQGGTVKNLYLKDITVSGNERVGGLVGQTYGGATILNCAVSGTVTGTNRSVGGIVGRVFNSDPITIQNCWCSATVSTDNGWDGLGVGGLVGLCENNATITNCIFTGPTVSGGGWCAGAIGTIENSSTNTLTGIVVTNAAITGALGYFNGCGAVIGNVDGISGSTINNILADHSSVTLGRAFVSNTTGQDGLDKTTAELKQQATYEAINWSFGNTEVAPWTINENNGYPELCFTVGTPLVPPSSLCTVSFTVKDALGATIDDAVVIVGDSTKTAGVAGVYDFSLLSGTYDYEVAKANYDTVRGTVTVITADINRNITMYETLVPADFAAGDGSSANPYQITSAAELASVKFHPSSSFVLMNDINLERVDWSFNALGDILSPFRGTFNGNGHTIENSSLTSINPWLGFFGYIEGGTVKNLYLKNATVRGTNFVGGLVGQMDGGTILNCAVSGTVAGTGSNIGGIVGRILADNNNPVTIQNCWSNTNVSTSGTAYTFAGIGGIVGQCEDKAAVRNCFFTGSVTAGARGAGAIGYNGNGTITAPENTFTGLVVANATITKGGGGAEHFGRIIGTFQGAASTIDNNLANDVTFVNMTRDVSSSLATGQDGLTTPDADLKQQATYTNIGWSFGNTEAAPWTIDESNDYPQLCFMVDTPFVSTVTFDIKDALTLPITDAVVTLGATSKAAGDYVFTDVVVGIYPYVIARADYDTVRGSVLVSTENVTKEVAMQLTVVPNLVAPVITTVLLPAGTVDTAYSVTLAATGDVPIVWTKIAGNLPAGLTLSTGGVISGTPTAAVAIASFSIEARNLGGSDTIQLTLTINAAGTLPPPTAVATQGIASLQIYPNPTTNGELRIESGELNAGDKVEIYNVNGALVLSVPSTGSGINSINIGHLPAGVYIVKAGNKVAKVVKQ
ncbi:hypothetical protein AGMMS4956_13660 [Bacteroidia bacterium]|nr:hypothetical protein AGMMS4956_13660 [Bacteroidia bacterium]